MNTDERGYFDSLTERGLGAIFEVSNTLDAGFLEKSTSVHCSPNSAFVASGLLAKFHVNFQKPKVEWKRIVNGFQRWT